MRKAFTVNKVSVLLWAALVLMATAGEAFAVLADACAKQTSVQANSAGCSYWMSLVPPQPAMQAQCQQACERATSAAKQAQSTCKGAAAEDQALQAKGQSDAGAAAGGPNDMQQVNQTSNAANMCTNQTNQLARQTAGQKVPGAMDQCAQAADACNNLKGDANQVKSSCQAAKTQAVAENSARGAEAAEMGAKCGKSADNAKGLGELPQMPQMPQMGGAGETPTNSGLTDNSTTDTSKKDNNVSDLGGTSQIAPVAFNNEAGTSGSEGNLPGSPDSFISGATAGSQPTYDDYNSGKEFAPPPSRQGMNLGSSTGASGGGGGAAGGGHSGASKSGEEVAAVKPENASNELNMNAGARPMLGLKPKEGEEDLTALAAFAAGETPKLAGALGAANGAGRGPASTKGAQASNASEEASSIFKMVRSRYSRLREVGKI